MNTEIRRSLVAVVLLVIAGCNRGTDLPNKETNKNQESVIAFVAASTKDAVQEIATAFTEEKKNVVKINADDSSKLATQITHDAPAHLFLSANEKWADFVKEKGFVQESTHLLGNALVIVVPKGNPATIARADDLTKPSVQRLAIAGPTVPAGMYARQALKKLGLWNSLEKNNKVVFGENVRVTLAYVERGEVEAGIVYATDAKITDKVETVFSFGKEDHEPIRYSLVLLKEGQESPAARSFFDFLRTSKAKAIFAKHGFSILDGK
jgi:molybdate transport system substrate-binding protein